MCEGDSAASLLNTCSLALNGFNFTWVNTSYGLLLRAMCIPATFLEGGCGMMQGLDLPMLLLESQRLAVLRYDAGLHR